MRTCYYFRGDASFRATGIDGLSGSCIHNPSKIHENIENGWNFIQFKNALFAVY